MALLGRGHPADFGTLPQHRARGFTRAVIGAAIGVFFALETVLAGVVFLIGTATLMIGCGILAYEVFLPLLVDSEPRRLPATIGAVTALLGGVIALTSFVVAYRSACRLR